jgi:glucose-6-phosphate 1-dehydrogenase
MNEKYLEADCEGMSTGTPPEPCVVVIFGASGDLAHASWSPRSTRWHAKNYCPSAYQWLLLDAMQGDQTLFPNADWIYKAWSLVDPIVERWESEPWLELPNYAAGSLGSGCRRRIDQTRWAGMVCGMKNRLKLDDSVFVTFTVRTLLCENGDCLIQQVCTK